MLEIKASRAATSVDLSTGSVNQGLTHFVRKTTGATNEVAIT